MSDQTTLFTEEPKQQATSTDATVLATEKTAQEKVTQTDPYVSMLDGIVTSDGRKKYATVSDALNSIPSKESHIQQLEAELATLRDQVKARKTVEDSLALATQQTTSVPADSVATDEQALEKLVHKVLSGKEAQTKQQANKQTVVSALVEKYGDKAEEVYTAKARELGVDVHTLDTLALTAPAMVLSHFGETKKTPQSSYKPSINVDGARALPNTDRKKVMLGGASTRDIVDTWKNCRPTTN